MEWLSILAIYEYDAAGGYDTNGNVLSYTDTVMGPWNFGYDQLNRLVTAQNGDAYLAGTPDPPAHSWAANFCWAYDAFGNRLAQSTSDVAFTAGDGSCTTSGTVYQNTWATFSAQNQIVASNASGIADPPTYDGAGDMADDDRNAYLYDAEGRICVTWGPEGGTGYLYDAAGNRVAKGTINAWTCDMSENGFTQTEGYVVGLAGEQLTELDAADVTTANPGGWAHTNVYAGGKLIGTYDGNVSAPTLHFHFDDPLGTRRAQANASGVIEAQYQSLPFGDGYAQSGSVADPTENHFTGKERDTESGNDYFMARYYNSVTGRFLSPDWSAKQQPVPYARLDDPQSLNLYAYVENNPVGQADPDGHAQVEWLRRKAVALAWDQERELVQKTGLGTREWTAAQRQELISRGRVAGFEGHHINNVANHPELAGDPDNVDFKTRAEHFAEHGGNWQTETNGSLISRMSMINDVSSVIMGIDMAIKALVQANAESVTGVHEDLSGGTSIADPTKAAQALDGAAIETYDWWTGKATGSYTVKNGTYYGGDGKAADPNSLKGQSFRIVPGGG